MMANTKHSMQEAIEIQKAFQAEFGNFQGVSGVGICLNQNADDLALSVLVNGEKDAEKLPRTFGGLDVLVQLVGTIRAL